MWKYISKYFYPLGAPGPAGQRGRWEREERKRGSSEEERDGWTDGKSTYGACQRFWYGGQDVWLSGDNQLLPGSRGSSSCWLWGDLRSVLNVMEMLSRILRTHMFKLKVYSPPTLYFAGLGKKSSGAGGGGPGWGSSSAWGRWRRGFIWVQICQICCYLFSGHHLVYLCSPAPQTASVVPWWWGKSAGRNRVFQNPKAAGLMCI